MNAPLAVSGLRTDPCAAWAPPRPPNDPDAIADRALRVVERVVGMILDDMERGDWSWLAYLPGAR